MWETNIPKLKKHKRITTFFQPNETINFQKPNYHNQRTEVRSFAALRLSGIEAWGAKEALQLWGFEACKKRQEAPKRQSVKEPQSAKAPKHQAAPSSAKQRQAAPSSAKQRQAAPSSAKQRQAAPKHPSIEALRLWGFKTQDTEEALQLWGFKIEAWGAKEALQLWGFEAWGAKEALQLWGFEAWGAKKALQLWGFWGVRRQRGFAALRLWAFEAWGAKEALQLWGFEAWGANEALQLWGVANLSGPDPPYSGKGKDDKGKGKGKNLTKARVKITRARAKATMAKVRLRRVDRRVFRHRSPTCNFLLGSPVNAQASAFELMREQRLRMIRIRRIHPTKCQKAVQWQMDPRDGMKLWCKLHRIAKMMEVFPLWLELAIPRQFFHLCPTACRLPSNGRTAGTILWPRSIMKRWTLQFRSLHGFGTPMNGAAQSWRWGSMRTTAWVTIHLLKRFSTNPIRSASMQRRWLANSARRWLRHLVHRVQTCVAFCCVAESMFSWMPDMSMSGTSNGVELCMVHGSWCLRRFLSMSPEFNAIWMPCRISRFPWWCARLHGLRLRRTSRWAMYVFLSTSTRICNTGYN